MRLFLSFITLVITRTYAVATSCTSADIAIWGSAENARSKLINCVATSAGQFKTCLAASVTGYSTMSEACKTCTIDDYYSHEGAGCFLVTLLDPTGSQASSCKTANLEGWRAACDSTYNTGGSNGAASAVSVGALIITAVAIVASSL